MEKLIDGKMIVTHVSSNLNLGHYTCTIPWKGDGPNLVNNINAVLTRQRRTNISDYLVKKRTSLKEIDEKFQDLRCHELFPNVKIPNVIFPNVKILIRALLTHKNPET